MTAAIFLDRDGTLIEPVHYLCHAEQVRLLPGVGSALREWRRLGFACVVVTNQAAVGKGLLSVAGLGRVHARLEELLAAEGARVDGIYFCPEPQRGADRRRIEHPDRKPGPGLLLRAARELGLELGGSWMVGDALTDTLAGRNSGCARSVLVRSPHSRPSDERDPSVDFVVDDLPQALSLTQARATRPDLAHQLRR